MNLTTNQNPNPSSTPKELSWQALEFTEYKKHPLWYVALAVLIAGLVLYGIYTQSWTTVVTFILFGLMIANYAARKPKTVTVKLTSNGVSVDTANYEYKVVRKFWIIYYPPEVKTLYLETNAYLNNLIRIELGNQDPRKVKEFLKPYLEEDLEATESIADVIARKLKF